MERWTRDDHKDALQKVATANKDQLRWGSGFKSIRPWKANNIYYQINIHYWVKVKVKWIGKPRQVPLIR